MKGKFLIVCSILLGGLHDLYAQENKRITVYNAIENDSISVELEGTTIYASDQPDVAAIIKLIQEDTTFYKAFKNLHFTNYNADNTINIYDKKASTVVAKHNSETKHIYRNDCRWMLFLEENTSGKYYNRKQRPEFYTAALYESIFFTRDTVCGERNELDKAYLNPSGNTIEKSKAQLKQLMFSPGRKISGIPFMGNKAAIFDKEIASLYDFKVAKEEKDGHICYLFQAVPKSGNEGKVVYQNFQTWLDVNDHSIVARNYILKYSTAVYDFNVSMKVSLIKKGNKLLPSYISYNGNWRAATQGREIVTFQTKFYY